MDDADGVRDGVGRGRVKAGQEGVGVDRAQSQRGRRAGGKIAQVGGDDQVGAGRQRGFVSYASLGVAQLGQVYEGLMSFHGTIADNIRFARPDATDADIRRAADAALVQRFAARLPDGLETRIGEGGYGLSGGQAHRVGLARLFLRDPALILLDEPTAHLDTATEDELMANILAFAKGRMLVMATHSSGAAARMTTVLRFADGVLVPCGGRAARVRLVGKDAA